ncbi:MAG: DUF4357 domain-containing protein [Devosia sp.]
MGFVIFAGSTARQAASGTFPAGYAALRDKLIASEQLVQGPSPELLAFASDVTFSSPSAAASIVSGRSASGPLEWKIQPQGLCYRDWRAANLQLAIGYYQRLAVTDAWEAPTRSTFKLALGKEGKAVTALSRYLMALQDMPAAERVSRTFDEETDTVESGAVLTRHTAVVGKVDRQTPILSSKVHQVKFNPYWTVPESIIEKDLVRYMHEDPDYLTKFRIRVFDGKGNEVAPASLDWSSAADPLRYTFRQDPGGDNSLGRCKIDFYNPHDVYLHDTPAKQLFGQNDRFYSSGCVRAQNIEVIAAWLLADNGGWDLSSVQAMFAADENVNVPLTFQMPIHTTYVTAWVTQLGTVSFRDDIYGHDAAGRVDFS